MTKRCQQLLRIAAAEEITGDKVRGLIDLLLAVKQGPQLLQ